MKIAVVGGGGFIGHHIVKALTGEHEILVLDNWSTGSMKNIGKDILGRNVCVDMRDSNLVAFAFELFKPEIVIHCAWKESTGNTPEDAQSNYVGSVNLAAISVMYGVKQFIFLSTAEVYGNAEILPTPETALIRCQDNYAVDKFAVEEHLRMIKRAYGMKYNILRLGEVYGEGMKSGVIYDMLRCVFDSERVSLLSEGKSNRDFIYVGDIIKIITAACKNEKSATYNIAYGDSHTYAEVFKNMCSIVNVDRSFEPEEDEDHIYEMQLSIKEAAKELSFEPTTTLQVGLQKTITWYKEHSARRE